MKETSKHLGVTINTVVLAMTPGTLRELPMHYDGRAEKPLVASVPVGTETSPDRVTGNELGVVDIRRAVGLSAELTAVDTAMAPATAIV